MSLKSLKLDNQISHQNISFLFSAKPKITYVENQTAMELEEQVTLTCEASGDPIPSITWRTSTRNISSEEKVQRRPRVSGVWDADLKHLKSTPCPVPFGTWENGMGVIHSHCWSCSFPPPAYLVVVYSTPSCNGMGTVPCIDNQGHMGSGMVKLDVLGRGAIVNF